MKSAPGSEERTASMTKAILRIAAIGILVAVTLLMPFGLGLQGRGRHGVTLADAAGGCSDASLARAYGGLASGFVLTDPVGMPLANPSPLVAVGLGVFDGVGGETGMLTENFGGKVVQLSGTATYSVNADCTGAFTNQFPGGGTFTWSLAVGGGGKIYQLASTDFWDSRMGVDMGGRGA